MTEVLAALRLLRSRPGFTLMAAGILALGIGGCVAIFSILNGVLLSPLPYDAADRVVLIEQHAADEVGGTGRMAWPDYVELTNAALPLTSTAAYLHSPGTLNARVRSGDDVHSVPVTYVSADFFATLGIEAARGRVIGAEHDVPGAAAFVVLSDATWRQRFAADPGIVGRSVQVDDRAFTVIGVAPPEMQFPDSEIGAWLPLSLITDDDAPRVRGNRFIAAIARLEPGADPAAVRSAVAARFASIAGEHPATNATLVRAELKTLTDAVLGDVRRPITILMATMLIVLLIASANVANLLLARVSGRSLELAVRSALGAARARIARQLLIENLLLTLGGTIAGLVLAHFAVRLFVQLAGSNLPRPESIRLDGTVLLFTLALALVTALLTGALPAFRAARVPVQRTLREGGRGTDTRAGLRSRGALVIFETALATCLLIGSALMVRSFINLLRVDPGFEREAVLTFGISIPDEDIPAYRTALVERLEDIPGVESVAGSKTTPLQGGGEPLRFEQVLDDGSTRTFEPASGAFFVSAGYFATLGIPVVAGREYHEQESATEALPLVVNQAAAERLWPGEPAVGRRLRVGETPVEVVGVVGSVRSAGIATAPEPAAYILWDFAPRTSAKFFLRTRSDPERLAPLVRAAVRDHDPSLPVPEVATMSALVSEQLATPRLLTALIGLFGAVALLLAALGLYGVIAYTVAQRSHEIGIRMALGASRHRVVAMVVRQAMSLTGAGIIAGVVAAFAGTRVMQGLLYDVAPADPVSFVVVPVLLLCVALAASALPALRAASIDPAVSFRR